MTEVLETIRSEAEALLRYVAADRLPVDAGAVAKLHILMGEIFEAGRQSVYDEQAQEAAEGCDGTGCTWACPDCGCQNCHEAFCWACGACQPEPVPAPDSLEDRP
jgi:hypothetical protein